MVVTAVQNEGYAPSALEAQLRATLNLVPAYTWYAAPSDALRFVNERAADFGGLPKDHPLRFGAGAGEEWDLHIAFLHPDDCDEARRVWADCLRTGRAGEVSFRVRAADGGYRWFVSRAEPVLDANGTVLYWIEVRVINLIGGVKTARMLAERAGRLLKRAVMELGGFNPMIILDDVGMDYAVRPATFGSFFHQGQICLNTRRIIIQRKIYEEFLGKFVARTNSLPAGDPHDPKTIIGPIITRDAVKMIDDRVKDTLARGARAHTGAKHDGQIYYPTILTDVPLDAAIANEETFGPVVVVEAVDTPEGAIAAANRTMYGLTSPILAGNTYKAFEMAPKVLAGIVNVNSPTVNDEIHAPMGGVRDSGWGRTGSRSLDDFSDLIWINSHSGQRQYPF